MISTEFHGDVLLLDDSDKIIISENAKSCYGNVLNCTDGLTVAMWVKMVFVGIRPAKDEFLVDNSLPGYIGWTIALDGGGKIQIINF